jgi:methylated-DNA-[protein]-cysteine S-methyltransferase
MIYYTYVDTPLQPLLLTSNGRALTGLYMATQKYGPQIGADWTCRDNAQPFEEARQQIAAYFAGTRQMFDLPLDPMGTDFQKQVWEELTRIPYGQTISYGELARRIGNPGASRAVGLANARNPISVLVPCHRVIGASGKLTGYSGGTERKNALLTYEASVLAHGPQPFAPLETVY